MSNDRAPVVWHIDDNDGDLALVAIALREAAQPIRLRSFSNAAIALDELTVVSADDQPDLLLLDVNMPGMGGIEFLRMVQSEPRLQHLRIAVLSGATIPACHDLLTYLGVSCVLMKPSTIQEFPALTASVLAALSGGIPTVALAMRQRS